MESLNREQKRQLQRQGQLNAQGAPTRTPPSKPASRPSEQRTSPMQFLREVRSELRKVAWPTRSEVVNYSIIVLMTVVVITTLVALIDVAFGRAILWLYST